MKHTRVWKQEPKSWDATKTWSEPRERFQKGNSEEMRSTADEMRPRACPIAGNPLIALKLHETYTGTKKKSAPNGSTVRKSLSSKAL